MRGPYFDADTQRTEDNQGGRKRYLCVTINFEIPQDSLNNFAFKGDSFRFKKYFN